MMLRLFAALAVVAAFGPSVSAQSDLDRFMGRVLARRDENWKKLQQYVLAEDERFHLLGPGGVRLYGFSRQYTWFIRQGYFIRSPVKFDGVTISEEDRTREERRWIEREGARENGGRKRGKGGGKGPPPTPGPTNQPPASVEDVLKQSLEPRF